MIEVKQLVPDAPPALDLAAVMQLVTPGARARKNKSLLLYLHVPFCSSKCHFCDWVVGYRTADLTDTGGELRKWYVDALCRQIAGYAPRLRDLGYRTTNVYWGGGTPTRLEPRELSRVHDTLAREFDLAEVEEYTVECSPETVTPEHVEALLACGMNRLSIGVQSFDDAVLRRMGRSHDSAGAEAALRMAMRSGATNLNIDLIVGFPGQSSTSCLSAVRRAIDLGVPHVSLYLFREFASDLVAVRQKGAHPRSGRGGDATNYMDGKSMLEAAGYHEYVVGYFARGSRHEFLGEQYYFGFRGDYFGLGAGASSTVGRCALKTGAAARYGDSHVRAYASDPERMIAGPLEAMPDELYLSSYFKAFATKDGIRFDRWKDQFGSEFKNFLKTRPALQAWFDAEEAGGARFVETKQGIALSSDTWVETMMWRR